MFTSNCHSVLVNYINVFYLQLQLLVGGDEPNGADSIRHRGTCPPPLLRMSARRGTMSRKTANKKTTKLYWPSRKHSPKQLILLGPKKWRGTTKKNSGALRRIGAPTFAPDRCPRLSNSFRCHWMSPLRHPPTSSTLAAPSRPQSRLSVRPPQSLTQIGALDGAEIAETVTTE